MGTEEDVEDGTGSWLVADLAHLMGSLYKGSLSAENSAFRRIKVINPIIPRVVSEKELQAFSFLGKFVTGFAVEIS